MGLAAQVISRVPAEKLAQLTNAGPGSTAYDSGILDDAVADVVGDLSTYANVTYDNDDARHVAAAWKGVILTLLAYKADVQSMDRLEQWRESLKKGLRMVTHGRRLLPKRGGPQYTPSQPPDGAIVRPLTDSSWLAQILPAAGYQQDWQGPQ